MNTVHTTAAFFWDISQKYFSYALMNDEKCTFIFNPKAISLNAYIKGKKLELTQQLKQKIDQELNCFFKLIAKEKNKNHHKLSLHFKTVSDASAAKANGTSKIIILAKANSAKKAASNAKNSKAALTRPAHLPFTQNEVSRYINIKLKEFIEKNKIEAKQLKSKLSGVNLRKFKNALTSLKLIKGKNTAPQVHTLAAALHITKNNCDEAIRKLWKAQHHCIHQRMLGKLKNQYQHWYAHI